MNWFIGVAAYVIIWWTVIFTVLPFGVRSSEEDDPGRGAGAPANPRLGIKALVTTGISCVLWLAFYWVVSADLINFRGP